MEKEHVSAKDCLTDLDENSKVGIMFGRENNGLSNEEITLADKIVTVPVSENYPSLNIAQAVSIICYEWFATIHTPSQEAKEVATKGEMIKLFEHLEQELDKGCFFKRGSRRDKMVRNIRNMIGRSQMSPQEVQTFRGIISALTKSQ
jgi:tRNA/rRNA methyltransferase